MTKYLDLDEIVVPEKVLKLFKEEHVMKPLSVEDFISNIKEAKKLEASGESDVGDHILALTGMIGKLFPTVTQETLGKLSMSQLNAILAFARDDDGDENVGKEATPGNVATAAK